MRTTLLRCVAVVAAIALMLPPAGMAQAPTAATAAAAGFSTEQIDALLAPIALYPDDLLTQVLMASTYPLQVVDASRWLEQPGNKSLTGDALAKALVPQNWDPSVKSLVPFPQVLAMLNGQLDWMQQLGYAFSTQQAAVMNSVQRLRRQAQAAGNLKSTEQQQVVAAQDAIVIQPANPQTVYVPIYNPTTIYGTWPYPAYPPIYLPPPPGYAIGTAVVAGLAFAAGVAVVGSLWGWARPSWGGSQVNVNVNRYNSINVNRAQINSNVWRAPAAGVAGRPIRPPNGPVGAPGRPAGLPANAVGRPNVQVPGNLVNRPAAGNNVQRPANGNIQRPANGNIQRPANAANRPAAPAQRPAGAFNGVNEGARASQFSNRGAQSRSFQRPAGNAGGARGGFRNR